MKEKDCGSCAYKRSKVEMIGNGWSGTVDYCKADTEPDTYGVCRDWKPSRLERIKTIFRREK